MAQSLERLFLNPSLREQFGRNGREIFLDRFTEKQMILRTLEVYRFLLKKDVAPCPAETLTAAGPSAVDSSV
jgi:glycosyltransferase involved in cell wall biosynthesis